MTPDVVRDCAAAREQPKPQYTIADAITDAQFYRQQPEYIVDLEKAKRVIDTLLSALEASPCYFKGARLGIPTFTLLAYDRAGHSAMLDWADAAEAHGCRAEKINEARAHAIEWADRPDARWPD